MYNQIETPREGGGGAPFFLKKKAVTGYLLFIFLCYINLKKKKGHAQIFIKRQLNKNKLLKS